MPNRPQTRFPGLPLGQRFAYQGKRYVKTSPLLARDEDSGQTQMIPRSAWVEPLEGGAPAPSAASPDPALAALEELHQAAQACLDQLAATAPAQNASRARRELTEAYRRALKKITG